MSKLTKFTELRGCSFQRFPPSLAAVRSDLTDSFSGTRKTFGDETFALCHEGKKGTKADDNIGLGTCF